MTAPAPPVECLSSPGDAGGKGFNQAIAAARLGARAVLISCLGADAEGDEVLRALADDGVDTNAVLRVADVLTARTLINVDARGKKQTASYPAANLELSEKHFSVKRSPHRPDEESDGSWRHKGDHRRRRQ